MKKLILIIALALININIMFGQCPERESLGFFSQSDIDNFFFDYPNCTVIKSNLLIGDFLFVNNSINDLTKLSKIESIEGEFFIFNNTVLTSLDGLENLKTVGDNILIMLNPLLSNLDGLKNLATIEGSLRISNNPTLSSIKGINNLITIKKGLTISYNDNLENLSGLENIIRIDGYLSISNNAILKDLFALNNTSSIHALSIKGNPILVDLSVFQNIKSLTGPLNISNNTILENLTGLENINSIGDNLTISDNPNLSNLLGLKNINSIDSSLTISGNNNLINLSGLENINSVGKSLTISNNQKLTNLLGLENIISVGEFLSVSNIPKLKDLSSLKNINEIGGLHLNENEALESLAGLENINALTKNLGISHHTNLSNLTALKNISSIGGYLHISDNAVLRDISFLKNVRSLGGLLSIRNNPMLTSLSGLENIRSINGFISISNNDALTDLSGMANIQNGISLLKISDNALLSNCSLESVCNFIKNNPIDSVSIIENNAVGCNTKDEIIENCEGFAKTINQIFYDVNQNKVQDENEPLVSFGIVNISPNDIQIISNPATGLGVYYITEGNYTFNIDQASLSNWRLTTNSASYQLNLAEGDCQTVSFGVYPNQIISEIQSTVHSPNTRCNDTIPFDISTKNLGTTLAKGVIWFSVDSIINATKFVDQPDTIISPNQYGWFFDNLLPSQLVSQQVKLGIPGVEQFELGDSLTFESYVEFADKNGEQQSKTNTYQTLVRCSYDPNDKLVNPNRTCSHILMDENITYTIRFQNTGNDVAYKVSITDEIDANLDLNTFSLINSSHIDSFQTHITDNGTVTFEFNNINLPDSTSNLEGSQGYVSYSIKAKTDLPENTIIKNTSAIYFDYNPPIITNTVENILVNELPNIIWCQDVNENGLGNPNESIESCEQPEGYVMDCSDLNDLVSIEEESISDAITIYPNPSTGVFRLAVGDTNFRKATFSLYNANGQLIVEPTALNQTQLELAYPDLGNGVYYVQIKLDGLVLRKKLVVVK